MFELARQNYLKHHGYSEMHLKAALFDMDGVLYDSMPHHAVAWSESVKRFGLSISPEEVYMNEGRTGKSTINMLARRTWGREVSDEEAARIYAAKAECFAAQPEAPAMPGAAQLLARIKDQGLTIVLVTGSGQQTLLDHLNDTYPGIFTADHMVTSFDVHHGKPNPEPYLTGLRKAGVQPWEAIVVENAPLGVRSAVGANIFTIAVNTGPLPNSALLGEGANLLFGSMTELGDNWTDIYRALK